MSAVLDGKVAFITGAARGQGRSHAVRLAEAGADIIAVDACAAVALTDYPPATPADLDETASLVKDLGRRVVVRQVDVRDSAGLVAVAADAGAQLGGIDIVVANAAVVNWSRLWEMPDEQWQDLVDINLTGVFKTLKATVPIMIEQRRGGAIVIISSAAGLKALPGQAHYTASKHALVGLMRTAAIELAPFEIRVNTIHPGGVDTAMAAESETLNRLLAENPSYAMSFARLLDRPPLAQPSDISEALLYLVSPASRLVTGVALPVDAGATTV